MNKIGNDWDKMLSSQWNLDYYKDLQNFLEDEYKTHTIFPPKEEIFTALKLTSYKDTKVLILGQDPYHGKGQSHGLAFSVKPGIKIPPSLRNIFKEIQSSLGLEYPNNGYLVDWAKQGVLLLNTVLTVREADANSHKNKGWEILTDEIIKLLNEKTTPVIFVLWGNMAKSKEKFITNPKHYILKSSHPSPLSARHGFIGCNHFKKINEILEKEKLPIIDWQVKNI